MPQPLIDGLFHPLTIPESLVNDLETDSVKRSAFAGEWQALPCGPSFGVLLRDDAKGLPANDSAQVVFAGDLSVVAPPDLISFIAQGRYTGVLYVMSNRVDRYLVFRAGKLCWGGSNDPGERLGEVAIRAGLLTRERLQQALSKQAQDGHSAKLGQSLVRMGLLTGLEQWKAVQLRVTEILYALLVKTEGAFVFIDLPHHPGLESHLSLDLQGLLLEGFSRVDEMKHFRSRIPSSDVVCDQLASLSLPELSANEELILNAIDGHRTILDLGIHTGLGEFGATKAAFRLMELELITLVHGATPLAPSAAPATPARAPTPTNVRQLIASYNRVLRDAFFVASETELHDVYVSSMNEFLSQEELRHELSTPVTLQSDGTLAEEPLLKAMPDSSQVMTLMSVLDQVLSFALFQLRETIEPERMEKFVRHARKHLNVE